MIAPDLDPALQAVPLVSTVLSNDSPYLLGYLFTNASGVLRKITVTDGSGVAILYQIDVPETGVPAADGFPPWLHVVGVRWFADGGGVVGKIWGYKTWPF